ncbi:hypothetical protein Tco_1109601 [Tanacetum coccineum]
MIRTRSDKEKKRKIRETTEAWMNTPITFPLVSTKDVSEEPLIVETKIERYLVRRVYMDEGASVEVMFEQCFKNLSPTIKVRLKDTQTGLKNYDEVHRHQSNLAVQHNLGKVRLKKKQMIEEKTTEVERGKEEGAKEISITGEVLVNLAFPKQLVIIRGGLSKECKSQLNLLLKNNMEIFTWEPTDMTGVPRHIIEHSLNVNASIKPMC